MKMTGKSIVLPILLVGHSLVSTATASSITPQAVVGPNQCVAASAIADGSTVVLQTCNGSPLQQWTLMLDGGAHSSNVYRFQNAGSGLCIDVSNTLFNGLILTMGECTLSDGSGHPVSNAEYNSGARLPATTFLKSFVGNKLNNFCIDTINGVLFMNTCNGGVTQTWNTGF